MRTGAIVRHMALIDLPEEFEALSQATVGAIRRAYEVNAERHDPSIGDDAVVFGIGIYRNSWFMLEEEIESLEHWASARPLGSLVITGAGLRVHVYRHGQNADVDLDSFRLDDERASETQRLIAVSNTLQMTLPGLEPPVEETGLIDHDLPELVVVHAGNAEDGCCGIWIGTPIASEEGTGSPWGWVEPLWLAEPGESGLSTTGPKAPRTPRHDELPEPAIALEHVVEVGTETK
jgi:hypothetical protein